LTGAKTVFKTNHLAISKQNRTQPYYNTNKRNDINKITTDLLKQTPKHNETKA